MPASTGALDRLRQKVSKAVEAGDYYHAHQLYRTLAFRLTNQRNFEDLILLLDHGVNLLVDHKQLTSAYDLALLLMQALSDGSLSCERADILSILERTFSRLNPSHIIANGQENSTAEVTEPGMQNDAADIVVDRSVIIREAVNWSKTTEASHKYGCPKVHGVFAKVFWQDKNYRLARHHYMLTADGKAAAKLLIEYHVLKGLSGEVDLFISQAVLQFLSLDNEPTASVAFDEYTHEHPQIRAGPPFKKWPLLDFVWLLLLCIRDEPRQLARFTVLVERYQPSIARDPSYSDYLDKIGQVFFKVPPRRPTGPSGFFGNLLSGLLDDGSEDGEHCCDHLAGKSAIVPIDELD